MTRADSLIGASSLGTWARQSLQGEPARHHGSLIKMNACTTPQRHGIPAPPSVHAIKSSSLTAQMVYSNLE